MDLQVISSDSNHASAVAVADPIFAANFNEPLVHQVVVAFQAGARAGTKAQLTRGEVHASGKKPFRQKGTGRARAGTVKSPIWRKGGVTFAAKPRDHSQKVNKKMYRAAIRSILSELIRQERFVVVDNLELASAKTKDFIEKTKTYRKGMTLFITEGVDDALFLSSRNVPNVEVSDVVAVNPVSLVRAETVVITVAALKLLEERLG